MWGCVNKFQHKCISFEHTHTHTHAKARWTNMYRLTSWVVLFAQSKWCLLAFRPKFKPHLDVEHIYCFWSKRAITLYHTRSAWPIPAIINLPNSGSVTRQWHQYVQVEASHSLSGDLNIDCAEWGSNNQRKELKIVWHWRCGSTQASYFTFENKQLRSPR